MLEEFKIQIEDKVEENKKRSVLRWLDVLCFCLTH